MSTGRRVPPESSPVCQTGSLSTAYGMAGSTAGEENVLEATEHGSKQRSWVSSDR